MGKLHELHDNGQSVWLDFIRRDMLGPDGELAALVADGIRGVTSNPSIFQKAITTSQAYDGQIQSLLTTDAEASTQAVFEELAVRDIVHGRPVQNTDALENPGVLDYYRDLPELQV